MLCSERHRPAVTEGCVHGQSWGDYAPGISIWQPHGVVDLHREGVRGTYSGSPARWPEGHRTDDVHSGPAAAGQAICFPFLHPGSVTTERTQRQEVERDCEGFRPGLPKTGHFGMGIILS